ncbi:MAG TPA: serine--tRNA ligase [Candidatus Omnitrophica bacterium]|nr:serine--tRNA ligase [Candidatus Omnitrophota bacterium]
MLDLRFIRENSERIKKALKDRGEKLSLEEILALDRERRDILKEVEELKHKKNIASEEIGKLVRDGKDVTAAKAEMKALAEKIKKLDGRVKEKGGKLSRLLLFLPNIPHSSVPVGEDEEDNKVNREWGTIPQFNFTPKNHLEIAQNLRIIDFERASRIVGSNFPLYRDMGARLERALINFMLDLHTKEHGYTEIFPPFLANRRAMTGTGQLPKLEEDMYFIGADDFFLVPTAEVPLANLHAEETLEEDELPLYYTAYTACFRKEAGSYGKETKGLIRVHQFDKVELVKFVRQEDSYRELELMVKDAEEVLQRLRLPYRVSLLCTGEVGFAAAKCYDIEVWAPGLNRYLEISSCSNCEDFQARRINAKYRPRGGGKPVYLHTLNGSGVALARTVIAILENYQQEDGSVLIPEVLRAYMDGKTRIEKV